MKLTLLGTGDAFGSGGRYSTCLHLNADAHSMLVDCGATSMHALQKAAIDRAAITAVLVTHFHGDHFGGLPFFLLDAMFVTRRTRPLTIAGPKGVKERMRAACEVAFPGFFDRERSFALNFIEVSPGTPQTVAGFEVWAFPVVHDDLAGPCQAYRILRDGKVFAFSGDTTWTDTLIRVANGADLFLTECYTYDREMPNHLNWKTLESRLPELRAKRILITHMSGEMLKFDGPLPVERAHDGMTVTL